MGCPGTIALLGLECRVKFGQITELTLPEDRAINCRSTNCPALNCRSAVSFHAAFNDLYFTTVVRTTEYPKIFPVVSCKIL